MILKKIKMKKKPKKIFEILFENIKIGKNRFSREQSIFGLFNAVKEIEKEGYIHKDSVGEVWEVVVSDCESCFTESICATKEIALERMFAYRDGLVKEYKEMLYMDKEMFGNMIKALESDDWEKWNTYPQEHPRIRKTKIVNQSTINKEE